MRTFGVHGCPISGPLLSDRESFELYGPVTGYRMWWSTSGTGQLTGYAKYIPCQAMTGSLLYDYWGKCPISDADVADIYGSHRGSLFRTEIKFGSQIFISPAQDLRLFHRNEVRLTECMYEGRHVWSIVLWCGTENLWGEIDSWVKKWASVASVDILPAPSITCIGMSFTFYYYNCPSKNSHLTSSLSTICAFYTSFM